MKKMLSVLLTCLLMMAMLMPTALAEDASVYVSSTGDGTLNLRSGPGKSYDVKGYVYHSSSVTEISQSGEWSKVKVDATGKTGWIKTKYIDGTTKALGTGKQTVSCPSNLNLRSGPSTEYAIKGKVKNGASVKVLNTEDNWVKITDYTTGKTGWIMAKYIKGYTDSTGSTGTTTATDPHSVYCVTGATLNVRKGAGTSYGKVTTLFEGTAFKVVGTSGNWFKIETFDGVSGWVSKNYTTAGADAVITASKLNMRSGAGTGYGVKRTLARGTVVKVNSITGNWAHITVNGVSGHVSAKYLEF